MFCRVCVAERKEQALIRNNRKQNNIKTKKTKKTVIPPATPCKGS